MRTFAAVDLNDCSADKAAIWNMLGNDRCQPKADMAQLKARTNRLFVLKLFAQTYLSVSRR